MVLPLRIFTLLVVSILLNPSLCQKSENTIVQTLKQQSNSSGNIKIQKLNIPNFNICNFYFPLITVHKSLTDAKKANIKNETQISQLQKLTKNENIKANNQASFFSNPRTELNFPLPLDFSWSFPQINKKPSILNLNEQFNVTPQSSQANNKTQILQKAIPTNASIKNEDIKNSNDFTNQVQKQNDVDQRNTPNFINKIQNQTKINKNQELPTASIKLINKKDLNTQNPSFSTLLQPNHTLNYTIAQPSVSKANLILEHTNIVIINNLIPVSKQSNAKQTSGIQKQSVQKQQTKSIAPTLQTNPILSYDIKSNLPAPFKKQIKQSQKIVNQNTIENQINTSQTKIKVEQDRQLVSKTKITASLIPVYTAFQVPALFPDSTSVIFSPITFSTVPNFASKSTRFYGSSYYSYATGFPSTSSFFQPSCPNNSYWAGTICLPLVSQYSIKCSPGFQYRDKQCYYGRSIKVFSCKFGSWNGVSCVSQKYLQSSCKSGQYWNGNICLNYPSKSFMPSCSTGHYFHLVSASCLSYPSGSSSCKIGQFWDGSFCSEINSSVKCQNNSTWSGSACVLNLIKLCSVGQYFDGKTCVSLNAVSKFYEQLCQKFEYWDGLKCKKALTSSDAKCQKGYYWHSPLKCCLFQY